MKIFKTQLTLILGLTFLNLILLLVNIGAVKLPEKRLPGQIRSQGNKEIKEYKVGDEIKIAGYKIKFANPRYVFDEDSLMNTFKIDAAIQNQTFEPLIKLIANCDIVDSGKAMLEGSGVRIDAKEDHIHPKEKMNFTIVTYLEIDYSKESQSFADDRNLPGGHVSLFPNRRVTSCSFTPTGSYDPNIAVKVKFE